MAPSIPDRAEVVVVGGGIIGCSIAYHLTRRGITDVTVLEQGTLTCGTTWHAAGLVSQLKSSHSLTKLATTFKTNSAIPILSNESAVRSRHVEVEQYTP